MGTRRAASAEEVLDLARAAGFDLAGIAPLRSPAAAERFEAWLAAGHHADMAWLERDRARILDPRKTLPEGRSLLVVGLGHSRPATTTADGARVARYAAGRDYHNVVQKRLRKLGKRLVERGLGEWRAIVDAGPLMERSHAAEAGLGFESKAANLLSPAFGPWFFLGEILLEGELEPTPVPPAGSCGTCTACLDACPTAAILEPGVVDAGRCLSYQTIENRGPIPHELRTELGGWVFGCDVCSEVCPWGQRAPDTGARMGSHRALEGTLVDWLDGAPAAFDSLWVGSPLQRAGRDGLVRNAALALGARPSDAGRAALARRLEQDESALVREAAFWALARAHAGEKNVPAELERALARESDARARAGMTRSLGERG